MSPAPAWPYGPSPRVCVSLAEAEPALLLRDFETISGADLVEVRLDALAGEWRTAEVFAGLVDACPVAVGFTLRPAWQGGGYTGEETARRTLLEQAAAAGAAFIDVEMDADWAAPFIESASCPVILSHHWMDRSAADLDERAARARRMGASVVKLVGTAETPGDAAPFLLAGAGLRDAGQPAVCFCMGDAGRASRLLAAARGAPLIYAAAASGREVASGQWPLRALVEEMGVGSWRPDAGLLGLIGHPIEHSLSPAVFNAVFRRRGNGFAYVPVAGNELEETLQLLEAAGFRGVSVTMPFKAQMAARCPRKDFAVEATGAANTVVFGADGWSAFNTDGDAVVDALAEVREVRGARVAIVGAGGAARAAAAALARAGAKLTVLNRTPERAERAAGIIGAGWGPLDVIEKTAFDVIINATPVGMDAKLPSAIAGGAGEPGAELPGAIAGRVGGPEVKLRGATAGGTGGPEGEMAFPASWLRGNEVVFDMVYRPRRTPLLRAAERRGCIVIEGLEMFVRQAAAQYAHLTGERGEAPLGIMRAAAEAILSHDTAAQKMSPGGTGGL